MPNGITHPPVVTPYQPPPPPPPPAAPPTPAQRAAAIKWLIDTGFSEALITPDNIANAIAEGHGGTGTDVTADSLWAAEWALLLQRSPRPSIPAMEARMRFYDTAVSALVAAGEVEGAKRLIKEAFSDEGIAQETQLQDLKDKQTDANARLREFDDQWESLFVNPLGAQMVRGNLTPIEMDMLDTQMRMLPGLKAKYLGEFLAPGNEEIEPGGWLMSRRADFNRDLDFAAGQRIQIELAQARQGRAIELQRQYDAGILATGEPTFDLEAARGVLFQQEAQATVGGPVPSVTAIVGTQETLWARTHRSRADLDAISFAWQSTLGTENEFDLDTALNNARANPAAPLTGRGYGIIDQAQAAWQDSPGGKVALVNLAFPEGDARRGEGLVLLSQQPGLTANGIVNWVKNRESIRQRYAQLGDKANWNLEDALAALDKAPLFAVIEGSGANLAIDVAEADFPTTPRGMAKVLADKQQSIRNEWASTKDPDWTVADAFAALAKEPTLTWQQAIAQAQLPGIQARREATIRQLAKMRGLDPAAVLAWVQRQERADPKALDQLSENEIVAAYINSPEGKEAARVAAAPEREAAIRQAAIAAGLNPDRVVAWAKAFPALSAERIIQEYPDSPEGKADALRATNTQKIAVLRFRLTQPEGRNPARAKAIRDEIAKLEEEIERGMPTPPGGFTTPRPGAPAAPGAPTVPGAPAAPGAEAPAAPGAPTAPRGGPAAPGAPAAPTPTAPGVTGAPAAPPGAALTPEEEEARQRAGAARGAAGAQRGLDIHAWYFDPSASPEQQYLNAAKEAAARNYAREHPDWSDKNIQDMVAKDFREQDIGVAFRANPQLAAAARALLARNPNMTAQQAAQQATNEAITQRAGVVGARFPGADLTELLKPGEGGAYQPVNLADLHRALTAGQPATPGRPTLDISAWTRPGTFDVSDSPFGTGVFNTPEEMAKAATTIAEAQEATRRMWAEINAPRGLTATGERMPSAAEREAKYAEEERIRKQKLAETTPPPARLR